MQYQKNVCYPFSTIRHFELTLQREYYTWSHHLSPHLQDTEYEYTHHRIPHGLLFDHPLMDICNLTLSHPTFPASGFL